MSPAFAQERGGWSGSKFRPNIFTFGGFFADAARVAGEITPFVGAVLHVNGLLRRDPGESTEGMLFTLNLFGSVSFLDKFAAGLDLPAHGIRYGRLSPDGEWATTDNFGDLRLAFKYAPIEASLENFGVSFGADVTFPTANANHYGAERGLTFVPRVNLDFMSFRMGFHLMANAWLRLRTADNPDPVGTLPGFFVPRTGSGAEVGGLAGLSLFLDGAIFRLNLESRFETSLSSGVGTGSWHDHMLGIQYQDEGLSFGLGGGVALGDFGGPDWRALVSLAYQPWILGGYWSGRRGPLATPSQIEAIDKMNGQIAKAMNEGDLATAIALTRPLHSASCASDSMQACDMAYDALAKVERAVLEAPNKLPAFQAALVVKQASTELYVASPDQALTDERRNQLKERLADLEERARPDLEQRCSTLDNNDLAASAFFCYAMFAMTFPGDSAAEARRDALLAQVRREEAIGLEVNGPSDVGDPLGSRLSRYSALSRSESPGVTVAIQASPPKVKDEERSGKTSVRYVRGKRTEPNPRYEALVKDIEREQRYIVQNEKTIAQLQRSHAASPRDGNLSGIENERRQIKRNEENIARMQKELERTSRTREVDDYANMDLPAQFRTVVVSRDVRVRVSIDGNEIFEISKTFTESSSSTSHSGDRARGIAPESGSIVDADGLDERILSAIERLVQREFSPRFAAWVAKRAKVSSGANDADSIERAARAFVLYPEDANPGLAAVLRRNLGVSNPARVLGVPVDAPSPVVEGGDGE